MDESQNIILNEVTRKKFTVSLFLYGTLKKKFKSTEAESRSGVTWSPSKNYLKKGSRSSQ